MRKGEGSKWSPLRGRVVQPFSDTCSHLQLSYPWLVDAPSKLSAAPIRVGISECWSRRSSNRSEDTREEQ